HGLITRGGYDARPVGAPAALQTLARTLPAFEDKPLISLAGAVSLCLRGGRDAEQIEGAVLCAGGGGEDGGEAITPEANDIAGERGEIAQQGVEAVHRERFAIGPVGAFAGGLA